MLLGVSIKQGCKRNLQVMSGDDSSTLKKTTRRVILLPQTLCRIISSIRGVANHARRTRHRVKCDYHVCLLTF